MFILLPSIYLSWITSVISDTLISEISVTVLHIWCVFLSKKWSYLDYITSRYLRNQQIWFWKTNAKIKLLILLTSNIYQRYKSAENFSFTVCMHLERISIAILRLIFWNISFLHGSIFKGFTWENLGKFLSKLLFRK